MDYITLNDIAAKIEVSPSTVRYYRDKYIEFIPVIGAGKRRRYRPEVIDIFKVIARETQDGKTADQIRKTLEARYTKEIEVYPEIANEIATTTQSNNNLQLKLFIEEMKEVFELARMKDKEEVRGEIQTLEKTVGHWISDVEDKTQSLELRIAELEKQRNQTMWEKIKSWFR